MSTEIADLKERVEHLERIVSSLESRLDMDEMHLQIVSDGRPVKAAADSAAPPPTLLGERVTLEQIDARLRSVILNQGRHASDLRTVIRNMLVLTERKSS